MFTDTYTYAKRLRIDHKPLGLSNHPLKQSTSGNFGNLKLSPVGSDIERECYHGYCQSTISFLGGGGDGGGGVWYRMETTSGLTSVAIENENELNFARFLSRF